MGSPITVAGERAFLTKHLSYIAGREWVDEMYAEMNQLLSQLRATNGTAAPKPIVRCHLCDGPMRIDDVAACARCGGCGESWTGEQLVAQLALIEEMSRPRTDDGRVMMTVAQIVARFGGNANSVRVRLSRAGVKGVDGYYDTGVFDTVTAC